VGFMNDKIVVARPNQKTSKQVPPQWADDSLSAFIETAKQNSYATFVNHKAAYKQLLKVDELFRDAIDCLVNTKDWFPSFFLLRSHSAYLGAVRLAISGQVGEAYMVLRGCLENALYGLFFYKNPNKAKLWYERHDSDIKRKEVRDEFKIYRMFQIIEKEGPNVSGACRDLYETCIDYGAHPNERSVSSVLDRAESGTAVNFNLKYLSGDSDVLRFCLLNTVRVGLCCLCIFELILKERFEISGLTNKLNPLAVKLKVKK